MRLILAALLLSTAGAAIASTPALDDRTAIQRYVRARAADAAGLVDAAAAGYGAALAASPGDEVLAIRAYRQAMLAGDRALAVRAARVLDARDLLPPDGRLLLLSEAVTTRDWKRASTTVDRIAQDDVFAFMVPVLRGWIAYGSKSRDPIAAVDAGPSALARAYAAEHRALILIAQGKWDDGIAAIRAQAGSAGGRSTRLRLAAAARLADKRRRDEALMLIAGDEPALEAGRALLTARRRLPAPVDTAAAGIAELFTRVAIDVNRERVTPLALTLARLATFLAPENAETWLVTSELLTAGDHHDAALAAIGNVAADDPFAGSARAARLQLLVKKGEQKTALAEAEARAAQSGATVDDWSRVGDLRSELGDHRAAAQAYGRAVALAEADPAKNGLWATLLQQGGALEQAEDWGPAKAALERAANLAPDQAVVLNYLGYAQLERRENLAEAEKLIEKASALSPDDASITDSLGWAYFIRGDVPKAIETLERAVSREPGDTTMNEHLGDAYWTAGRRIDARHAWNAALVYAEAKDAGRIRAKLDTGLTKATAAP
ncbi:hypothetical protein ABC347_16535 [Sphingomonas sp. 1P06PA]|uniref:tetratricopeptide repeat protein n=1 Tax=Sphingomonas sp. 1P06PA TaxID=554121 RepID=UPI0039A5CADC